MGGAMCHLRWLFQQWQLSYRYFLILPIILLNNSHSLHPFGTRIFHWPQIRKRMTGRKLSLNKVSGQGLHTIQPKLHFMHKQQTRVNTVGKLRKFQKHIKGEQFTNQIQYPLMAIQRLERNSAGKYPNAQRITALIENTNRPIFLLPRSR